ncbi:amidohydrolase [Bacillus massiliigorillae]|uniref:amidohydrolase n=1 Tax=Bacillus massiliigorillae TaxID=1243664 RepID=UPI0003A93A25|nr:amidohydrolase [Bacillus massiliigorillae]
MGADIVFLNGEIITVDSKNNVMQSIAIKKNKIIAVGSNQEINSYIDDGTKVINLEGKTVLPGFIDSHLHVLVGTNKLGIDCKEQNITSIKELLRDLQKKKLETPKGQWIRASGFNEMSMVEKRYPTIEELNDISNEHPIYISRTCNHISIVNNYALELAGMDTIQFDSSNNQIECNHNGKLTGRLIESANMKMFEASNYTDEELYKSFKLASDEFLSYGITSIHDAGGHGPNHFKTIFKSVKSGEMKVRVYAMICALNNSEEFVNKMIDAGIVTGIGDDRFRIGPAKIFLDGSSSGPTIATRKPYTSNEKDYGILYYTQEEIDRVLTRAHQNGFQITAHAQGDRAIEMLLNAIERLQTEFPREDCRHRIEHAGIAEPDLQLRMKKLNVIPIPNPPFFYEFGEGYIQNYGDRVDYMYPLHDYVNQGIVAAAGSDCPVTSCNPLLGIHVAVNRKSKNGISVGDRQRVNLLDAIRMYTWNGAYASFEEDRKGSLEVGKLADLVVLDSSLLKTEDKNIKDIKASMTMVDGEIVFERKLVQQ